MEKLKIVNNMNNANAITHNGKFHVDEVFSTVLLMKVFDNIKVARVPDVPENMKMEDKIIYDIGKGKYDHHQSNALTREDNVKYSSFGLLWKEYGRKYLEKIHCKNIEFAWKKFDQLLVETIDKIDNFQIESDCLKNYLISNIIEGFNPTWNSEDNPDERFKKAVKFAVIIFDNEINNILSEIDADIYLSSLKIKNCEYIVLDKYVPYNDFIIKHDSEEKIKFVIYPSKRNGYEVRTVLGRKEFPKEWTNLSEKEFYNEYKVNGVLYCHSNRKLCITSSVESAIKVVELT